MGKPLKVLNQIIDDRALELRVFAYPLPPSPFSLTGLAGVGYRGSTSRDGSNIPFFYRVDAIGVRGFHLMPKRAGREVPSADLDALLQKLLAQTPNPLSATRVRRSLPPGYRIPLDRLQERLSVLARQGVLFEWPTNPRRYASRPLEVFIRERIIEVLKRHRTLTAAEISKKLPTVAKPLLAKILEELIKERRVWKHPKIGRREPYGLAPPNPLDYLRPKLDKLVATFRKLGFSPKGIREAFQEYLKTLLPDSEPDVQVILETMSRLNPQAARGALVYLPELRRALRDYFPDKGSFDRAVLRLAEEGKVQLQSHDLPSVLTHEEREAMIDNGRGGYFIAIGIRME